jgi:tRNA1(Val) A37 N6-methylase TrmN6
VPETPYPVPEELTADTLLDGRVRLTQPKGGYRVAIDPVLLAAAVPAGAGERVLDAGAGTGAASLCLAARVPGCRITALEIDRDLQRLLSQNVDDNGLARRIEAVVGDLERPPLRLQPASFDHVMTNPPYLPAASASPSPAPARARAHVEGLGLAPWLAACARMLRSGGRLTVIHRGDRLGEVLAALFGKVGETIVFPLWPLAGRPAKRILVQGRKGARGPLRLAAGLVLHDPDGRYGEATDRVLRGGAPLHLAPEGTEAEDG